jgi:hypothetical protein
VDENEDVMADHYNLTRTYLLLAYMADWIPVLRIRDVYPGSRILIFTHSGSRIQKQQQKRSEKKFVVILFFVATNFT